MCYKCGDCSWQLGWQSSRIRVAAATAEASDEFDAKPGEANELRANYMLLMAAGKPVWYQTLVWVTLTDTREASWVCFYQIPQTL